MFSCRKSDPEVMARSGVLLPALSISPLNQQPVSRRPGNLRGVRPRLYVTGTISADRMRLSSIRSTPMVPCGWRRRSVGEPGLNAIRRRRRARPAGCASGRRRPGGRPGTGGVAAAAGRPGPAVVDHRGGHAVEVELRGRRRAPGRDVGPVVVAEHGPDGRVGAELVQHGGGAHVAGVQDEVGAAQPRGHRGRAGLPPPRRMSVRHDDNPHAHHPRASARTSCGAARRFRRHRPSSMCTLQM